jgi:hypothetical protein
MSRDEDKCPSVHYWSQSRCIRPAGHEGLCWSKAVRGERTITRAEWRSEKGKFKSHHHYATSYPVNLGKGEPR